MNFIDLIFQMGCKKVLVVLLTCTTHRPPPPQSNGKKSNVSKREQNGVSQCSYQLNKSVTWSNSFFFAECKSRAVTEWYLSSHISVGQQEPFTGHFCVESGQLGSNATCISVKVFYTFIIFRSSLYNHLIFTDP